VISAEVLRRRAKEIAPDFLAEVAAIRKERLVGKRRKAVCECPIIGEHYSWCVMDAVPKSVNI